MTKLLGAIRCLGAWKPCRAQDTIVGTSSWVLPASCFYLKICTHICMCIYIYMNMRTYIYIYMQYIYMYIYIYVCVFAYVPGSYKHVTYLLSVQLLRVLANFILYVVLGYRCIYVCVYILPGCHVQLVVVLLETLPPAPCPRHGGPCLDTLCQFWMSGDVPNDTHSPKGAWAAKPG